MRSSTRSIRAISLRRALQARAADWNQNEADWRYMLANGRAWGFSQEDGTLLASTVVLPYGETTGEGFAWISMVLVLPEHRRRGFASRLLRRAIAHLTQCKLTLILDATPAGRAVYVREGFHDTWGFTRYRRGARHSPATKSPLPTRPVPSPAQHRQHQESAVRPIAEIRAIARGDWPALLTLDTPAFGAKREHLLRALAERLPQAALRAETEGRITGYVLGRDGREACQLGPLIAPDIDTARRLFDAAVAQLPGPLYIDVADRFSALQPRLDAAGFEAQRPFTRMVRGGKAAPGDAATVIAVAGPELG